MTRFPLYDSLNKNLSKKDLTITEKEEAVKMLKTIDEEGKKLVYTLVMIYYMETHDGILLPETELPYKGSIQDTESGMQTISWVFTDFPIPLRHILYKFLAFNTKKIQEEKDGEEQRSSLDNEYDSTC